MTRQTLLLLCALAPASAQPRDAAGEIRPVIEQMHRAWETLDMQKVRPL